MAPLSVSFRDPAGQMVEEGGVLLRLIEECARDDYDTMLSSGLCETLLAKGQIVPFTDVTDKYSQFESYKVLAPEHIAFISYPYEWCFSQLRAAALLTLSIQQTALRHGMTLKDASAFNIQFKNGQPIHIDTLSFTRRVADEPWVAYRQFCQHFLAPLTLMAYRDISAAKLAGLFSDGIPLENAARLLGKKWWRKPSLFLHITLHAWFERRGIGSAQKSKKQRKMSVAAQLNMLEHLSKLIASLPAPRTSTHWQHYHEEPPYTPEQYALKCSLVAQALEKCAPATVWDFGANSGTFAQLAVDSGASVVAFENEHALVERMLAQAKPDTSFLPLCMNLLAPSASNGWAHNERASLAARGPADMLLCLALTHHLAITGQVPFSRQAEYFADCTHDLLIEFIDPSDPNAQSMLQSQPALAARYTEEAFHATFDIYFTLIESHVIIPGKRSLYLYRRKNC